MKKSTFLLIILGFLFSNLYSQSQRGASDNDNPRSDRQFAITSDSGLKSMTGVGVAFTYYPSTNIALDAGFGVGVQRFKGGLRGRYLILQKNFTPYVGLGVFFHPTQVNNVEFISLNGFDPPYTADLNSSTYGQLIIGFEYMSDGGFVIGLNLGYSRNFNSTPWTSDVGAQQDIDLLNFLYGSGLCTGFNIGYAF